MDDYCEVCEGTDFVECPDCKGAGCKECDNSGSVACDCIIVPDNEWDYDDDE